MNKIKINRLILAGLATLLMFIAVEIFVEQLVGRSIFGGMYDQWYITTNVVHWKAANYILNIALALLNSTLLIWLYASLRPMFGVGYKTALIASGISVVLGFSMTINGINLGLFPARLGMVEWVYEVIELPLAMIVGALVYEGASAPQLA
ncbi:MAG: hypothetical protein JSV61_13695 [Anaerolineales bacterium]|nr:MAG: hypothetical protein JSV61_13695 [Anaerolineales bacterium]